MERSHTQHPSTDRQNHKQDSHDSLQGKKIDNSVEKVVADEANQLDVLVVRGETLHTLLELRAVLIRWKRREADRMRRNA